MFPKDVLIGTPLYALQRIADRWLVWAPDADPRLPAVRVVAVLDTAQRLNEKTLPGAPDKQLAVREEIVVWQSCHGFLPSSKKGGIN